MMNSRYPPIAPLTPASLFPIGEEEFNCFADGFPNSAPIINGLQLSSDTNGMGSSPPVQLMDMGFNMEMNMSFTGMRRNSEMVFPQMATNHVNRRNSAACLPSASMASPATGEFPVISHKPTPRALRAKRCPTNKCPCGGKDDCMEPGCIKSAGHYVCPVCNIEFSRKNSMRRHVLTHINLRPYECQACQKSFYRSDIYKRHLSSKKCRRNIPHQLSFDQQSTFPDLSSYLNHHIPFQ